MGILRLGSISLADRWVWLGAELAAPRTLGTLVWQFRIGRVGKLVSLSGWFRALCALVPRRTIGLVFKSWPSFMQVLVMVQASMGVLEWVARVVPVAERDRL